MKIKTTQFSLSKGLATVSRAVNPKSTQRMLGCVLIETEDDIKLTGNNMEMGIQTVIDGEAEGGEKIAVDAKTLLEIIRKMPDGDVTLETQDETLTIKGGKVKFGIPYRDGIEFPALPDTGKGTHFTLDGMVFKDMVKQTAFAVAENSSQKVMEGVNLVLSDGELAMTALDGYRVAVRKAVVDENKEVTAIVPGKTIKEIAAVLDNDKADFYVDDNYMMVILGGTTIISRLIDGKYFDVSPMLNSESTTKIEIDRKTLYGCIDRALLFAREGDKKAVVADISEGNVNIRIRASHGHMSEDINAVVDGNDLKIGFNPRFMAEALAAVEDDTVTLYMSNARSPMIIKDDEDTYKYLVLPVNIGEE